MDVEFFPTSIRDMGLEQDLREFMEETEEIYHDTGINQLLRLFDLIGKKTLHTVSKYASPFHFIGWPN